ncbi:MAG: flagellar FliJ family protein [Rhodoferax sp.]|nr:flagellar FliJ family protein [Rhodoferax sp.]
MHRLSGIALAVEHAQRQRDRLAEAHAHTQRTLADAQAQLEQLQTYARDTDARWIGATGSAYSAEVLRHYYQFGGRLQQAIQMQSGVIAGVANAVGEAHAALLQGEFRLAAIQRLHATRLQQIQQMKSRREQIQSDELATMQFLRTRKTLKSGVLHGT